MKAWMLPKACISHASNNDLPLKVQPASLLSFSANAQMVDLTFNVVYFWQGYVFAIWTKPKFA